MRIIVLNCYSRNSLAVINSLDPNYEIIGGAAKKRLFINPDRFFRSPRLSLIFRYTDPNKDPEKFKQDIIDACNLYKADAIIPTGTTTTNLLSYFKKDIAAATKTKLIVEDYHRLSELTDKWSTYKVCLKLKVPVPKTILLSKEEDVKNVMENFSFPVIIKPRLSYASKGVAFFENKDLFQKYMNLKKTILNSSYIAQEMIKGDLHDATLCARKGEILSILTQQRLVSLYDFGGGGIINITTYEPKLMEYAEKIVRYAGWNGVMLIDFIKAQNQFYLLECNPKVWGTTQLTIEAGLNVIQQMVDIFVSDKKDEARNQYKVGLLYKWIFPECFVHWFNKPLNFSLMLKRIRNTYKDYGANKKLNNLNIKDIKHLIGIVLDRDVF